MRSSVKTKKSTNFKAKGSRSKEDDMLRLNKGWAVKTENSIEFEVEMLRPTGKQRPSYQD